jgi:small acid-soluble spore protein O (minor)
MAKRKANHLDLEMNVAKNQGKGAEYNLELSNEPLTVEQKLNNKKRKKNQ